MNKNEKILKELEKLIIKQIELTEISKYSGQWIFCNGDGEDIVPSLIKIPNDLQPIDLKYETVIYNIQYMINIDDGKLDIIHGSDKHLDIPIYGSEKFFLIEESSLFALLI